MLLGLAFLDWLATRRYAQRHRTAIAHEGIEILRDELQAAPSTEADPAFGNPTDIDVTHD